MSGSSTAPERWTRLGRSSLLQTRIFEVDAIHYRHPKRGTERDFIVLNPPDWVNVVALTADGSLVLVRQFRYGIDGFSLETPGGVANAGEEPTATALRELREETGYTGGRTTVLGSVHPNPAIQSNRTHFVLVEDVRKTHELEWDADEEIEVVLVAVEEALAMARSGGITHSLVLNALMLFEPHWRARGGH